MLAALERARALFAFDARFRRGPAMWLIVKRWKGSGARAIAECRLLLESDPNDADIRVGLAGFLIEADQPAAARAELEAVHRLTPRSVIRLRVNINPDTR